jgi:hypothetical protein
MALLLGCATAPSRPVCIPPVPYSAETQGQAEAELAELERAGQAPVIRRFIEDYGDLRARNRAACA